MNDKMQQISARIRELREILELSAEEVAAQGGLKPDEYLAYEQAQADMPISALYAVANTLGVDATVLLTGETPRMSRYTVVRQGKGVTVERYKGYGFTSLAFNYIDREMEPMLVNLSKKDGRAELVTHKGNEFNYVLKGTVEVTVGGNSFVLNAGDSIYFDPALPHGQAAVSDEAEFLTVINENSHKYQRPNP